MKNRITKGLDIEIKGGTIMARTDKNPDQIIRIDGKNVFVEVMRGGFDIGKVHFNFIEYDDTQAQGSRIKKSLPIYLDIEKAMVLIHDTLSGRMTALAKRANETAKAQGYKFAKEIYSELGGVSARKLKERGKERPDGMSLSRQFKITPGAKMPWILSAEYGPGREDQKGLIVPQGKPEEIVRVPLSDEDFKKLMLVLKSHIDAFLVSEYMKPRETYQERKAREEQEQKQAG